MSTATQYPLVIASTKVHKEFHTDITVSSEDIQKALSLAVKGVGSATIATTTLVATVADRLKDELSAHIRSTINKCLSNNKGIVNMNEWGIAADSKLGKAIIRAVKKYLK